MKFSQSIFFTLSLMLIASAGFAGTDDATPISGNYSGHLETRTFLPSHDNDRTTTDMSTDIQLLLNGNVFIYQSKDAKAMGNYELNGDQIRFTVNSVKGNEKLVSSIFERTYKYSRSGDRLMLVGSSEDNHEVMVYHLSRK